jgi:DNA-binding MarR family transcriptional regulator
LFETIDVVNNNIAYDAANQTELPGQRPATLGGTVSERGLSQQQIRRGGSRRNEPARRNGRDIDLSDLNERIGYFVRRFQVAIFQDFIRTLAEIDIRPAQYSVLAVVAANGGLSQSDLADTLGIERARLVRLLDRLEKRGLLQRLASAKDRRAHALQLTPEGQRVYKQAHKLAASHEARIRESLGAQRYAQMLEMLRDVVR